MCITDGSARYLQALQGFSLAISGCTQVAQKVCVRQAAPASGRRCCNYKYVFQVREPGLLEDCLTLKLNLSPSGTNRFLAVTGILWLISREPYLLSRGLLRRLSLLAKCFFVIRPTPRSRLAVAVDTRRMSSRQTLSRDGCAVLTARFKALCRISSTHASTVSYCEAAGSCCNEFGETIGNCSLPKRGRGHIAVPRHPCISHPRQDEQGAKLECCSQGSEQCSCSRCGLLMLFR